MNGSKYATEYEQVSYSKVIPEPFMRFWVGIGRDNNPQKRTLADSFSPRSVYRADNELVFECNKTMYLVPECEKWALQGTHVNYEDYDQDQLLAMRIADNKRIQQEWLTDYMRRTKQSLEDVAAELKAFEHWDERPSKVGTFNGYELLCVDNHDGSYVYLVMTPCLNRERLCDMETRDDERAAKYLRLIVSYIDEFSDMFAKNERKSNRSVADATKTTAKAKAKPKSEPETKVQPKDEPKPAPKRGRGRPKGSKDSKPRKRRTKAEIAADAEVTVDAPTQGAIPKPKATPKPRRRRTKKQIIEEAMRIVAQQKAERERNGLEPTEDEKRSQRRSQWLRDRPKAVRDELGRVRLGDMGMLVTNRMAWVPDSIGRYSPSPIWTDGERDYVLNDKFFVPVPENAIVAKSQEIPGKVADANRRNHYI